MLSNKKDTLWYTYVYYFLMCQQITTWELNKLIIRKNQGICSPDDLWEELASIFIAVFIYFHLKISNYSKYNIEINIITLYIAI